MTETTLLDESAVSEIEARLPVSSYSTGIHKPQLRVLLTTAERDALCATVKYLREMMSDPVFGFQELQSRLAQVEQERDTARESVTWITTEKQKVEQKLSGAIQLCKDKAAKYEALIVNSLPNDQTAARTATAARTLRNLATELEKL